MREEGHMTRWEATATFRSALRDAVRDRRWTQAELARRIGVSQPTIGNWLRGRYIPSTTEVFAMERALGLVPGALSSHLGYLPAAVDSPLGRLLGVLLSSAEGRELLASLGSPTAAVPFSHAA